MLFEISKVIGSLIANEGIFHVFASNLANKVRR